MGALVAGLLAGRGGDPATRRPSRGSCAPPAWRRSRTRRPAGRAHGARRRRAEPRPLREEPRRRDRVRPAHRPLAAARRPRAARHHVDPATLEALVLLESAGRPTRGRRTTCAGGRPDADLAETGATFWALKVDVAASIRPRAAWTAASRSDAPPACARRRRSTSASTGQGLEATGRYLDFARSRLDGRDDLAVAAYHMASATSRRRWTATATWTSRTRSSSSTAPLRHAAAWRTLAALATLLDLPVAHRRRARRPAPAPRRPGELLRLERLHVQADSARRPAPARRHHPTFDDASAARDALGAGTLVAVARPDLAAHGLRQGGRRSPTRACGRCAEARRCSGSSATALAPSAAPRR